MRVWTVSELENVVFSTAPLIGARLQEVHTSPSDVVLGFYAQSTMLWLWLDLNALNPSMLPWSELPLRLKWKKTPLNLFLRAHFVGQTLLKVVQPPSEGRVVHLHFSSGAEEPLELELRLFPHGRNVLARARDKSLAWQKPKALMEAGSEPTSAYGGLQPRSLEVLREQWLDSRQTKGAKKLSADPKDKLREQLERKQRAFKKVGDELQRKLDLPWKTVGDWLKAHQTLDVPKDLEGFVDKRRKLSWNIEQSYQKAREGEGKIYGTQQRLEILRQEIEKLEAWIAGPGSALPAEMNQRATPPSLKNLNVNGRTLRLSEDLLVMAGKNASDNLKLLRKARAWDLWIHLRDYPSSHAIVFRNKNAKVGDHTMQEIAAWFVRNHLGQKYAASAGERFHLLVAECRFVRPIKGDKMGRVTHSDARGFIFKVPK